MQFQKEIIFHLYSINYIDKNKIFMIKIPKKNYQYLYYTVY